MTDFRHWPWWYYCIALTVFVLAVKGILILWNWKSYDSAERRIGKSFYTMAFMIVFTLLIMVLMQTSKFSSALAPAFSDWVRFGVFSWPVFSAFWIVFLLLALVFYSITRWFRLALLGEAVLEPDPQPVPQKTAKPQLVKSVRTQTQGFNTSIPRPSKSFSPSFLPREKTPFWERWDFSFLSENKTVILLCLGGITLFVILGWLFHRLLTMEWIDSEGYPISKPWWLWALPFLVLGLGGLGYKIVMIIRENMEDAASRPTPKPTSRPKAPGQRGFNMNAAGRGKFPSSRTQESKTNFVTSPVFWIIMGIAGIVILGILLARVFF